MATSRNPPSSRVRRPDGTMITRVGLRRHWAGDLYHFLLTASWPQLLGMIVGTWLAANALFAVGYCLLGGIENVEPGSYKDAFFFSIQTMATIGYGKMAPVSLPAHLLVTAEALTGMLAQAMATGLIFAKFARPTARVLFSNVAVIAQRDGAPALMFRMANERANQIVEASLHVAVLRFERTKEGERIRKVTDLPLIRNNTPALNLTWTAIHAITPQSPLHGATPESLAACEAIILVTLMGTDETLAQTIHARTYYPHDRIRWNARFVDILANVTDTDSVVDYTKFHDVVPDGPAPVALVSS
jgi:inward rectifier potassium channel